MKKIIGFIEPVVIISKNRETNILAKIDTGAYRSSIDMSIASDLGLRIVDVRTVKNVAASQTRPLVDIEFVLAGKKIKTKASVADRNHMEFPMIIGRLDIKEFLVDPTKKNK